MLPNRHVFSDLELHQVFADLQRPVIGLSRLRDEIVDRRRRNFVAGQEDQMRVRGELGLVWANTMPASRGVV